jgi:hypothetical protein
LDIHWISTGGKPNPKPNPKTVGEKSSQNPNPRDQKPADIQPETAPLPPLVKLEQDLMLMDKGNG